jgi:hypothetical protein
MPPGSTVLGLAEAVTASACAISEATVRLTSDWLEIHVGSHLQVAVTVSTAARLTPLVFA